MSNQVLIEKLSHEVDQTSSDLPSYLVGLMRDARDALQTDDTIVRLLNALASQVQDLLAHRDALQARNSELHDKVSALQAKAIA